MKALLITLLCFTSFTVMADDVNILNFGAVADGKTMNTKAIQAAIDQCSKTGGTVTIPDGTFLTGALRLKTNVNIHLADNALLMGSGHFVDYPNNIIKSRVRPGGGGEARTNKALLFADGESNIVIDGHGTINGNGVSPEFQMGDDSQSKLSNTRPVLILMTDCRNIKIENINLKNSAYWMQNYVDCINVHIKGISVYNHANFNNDAIDIDSKDVLVENSSFDSDDDGICLKSHAKGKICENVVIRNCSVRTNCNAIKFGTASVGGFRNINISNISIKQASEERIRHWQKVFKFIEQPVTVISGIAIENVDGGLTDNVTVNNIFMEDVQTAIFIRLGNRRAGHPGHLRNVTISNVTAVSHSKMTNSITGVPGYDAENIQLSNIRISGMGNGTAEEGALVAPESEKSYPENRIFGFAVPASGLFIRHVNGLSLQNVQLNLRNADFRPAILMDDVKNAQVSGINTTDSLVNATTLRVVNSQNVAIANAQIKNETLPYLVVEGDKTKAINASGLNKKRIQLTGAAKSEVTY
jgi:polygalacturonase